MLECDNKIEALEVFHCCCEVVGTQFASKTFDSVAALLLPAETAAWQMLYRSRFPLRIASPRQACCGAIARHCASEKIVHVKPSADQRLKPAFVHQMLAEAHPLLPSRHIGDAMATIDDGTGTDIVELGV